jgi:Tat protein translocase TatB subunit
MGSDAKEPKEPPMNVMGMGWQEMMIILVGALIIFGPNRLPEVAGQLGKAIRDLKKMTSELTGELERNAGLNDIKKAVQSELSGVQSQLNSVTGTVQKQVNSATSSVNSTVSSAVSPAKSTSSNVSSAKSTTSTTTAAKTSTGTTVQAKVVATKKDPLAGVTFMEEAVPIEAVAASNGTAKKSVATAKSAPTIDQLDAIGRARQRRAAAGYNKRAIT